MSTAAIPVLGVDALFDLPQPEWLIEGVLPEQAFIGLYGPTDSYKSFLSLSWALSIAAGVSWYGHDVKRGKVALIYSEGAYNLRQRVDAWLQHNGLDREELRDWLYVIPQGCDLTSEPSDADALEKAIRAATGGDVALIVLDTLNRCFGGGDENSSVDMTRFVASCDRLKVNLGCSMFVVHHTGYDASHARGSTVLKSSADAFLAIAKIGKTRVKLTFEKLKMSGARDPIVLDLVEMKDADSCVLVLDANARVDEKPKGKKLVALKVLEAGPLTFTEWAKAADVSTSSLDRWKTEWVGRGYVEGGGRAPWGLTDEGRALAGNGKKAALPSTLMVLP